MKLTPFAAMVISMLFTFIVVVVLVVHIDLRMKALEKRMELRGYKGYGDLGGAQRGEVII